MHENYTKDEFYDLVLVMRNAVKRSPGRIKGKYLDWSKLSLEILAEELENAGWKYGGNLRNIRELILPHEKTDFKGLEEYTANKESDTGKILKNVKIRAHDMIADFLSPAYTKLLSQELHQAGWGYKGKN